VGTAVGEGGTIIRTTNGGSLWFEQISGTTGALTDICFTDDNTGTVVGRETTRDGLILRTTDGGNTWWTSADNGVPELRSVDFADENTGWAVGDYGWILKTTDGGGSWKKLVSGVCQPLGPVRFVDSETGWVVAEGTVLRTTNGGVTSVSHRDSAKVPTEFLLSQNYPNPFNPSTTIRYSLPYRSRVVLTIFNTLGQHVALLQDGEEGSGDHEVKFDARGISSGVYFYRLHAGEFVQTRKLLLLH
jgi:hypothetical protein